MTPGDIRKFCGSCGATQEDSARFCGSCGTPLIDEPFGEVEFQEEEAPEQIYPYALYPDVELEREELSPAQPAKRRNGALWVAGLVTVVVGGIILANANNSENAAFIAGANSNSGSNSNTATAEPTSTASSTPPATKSNTTSSSSSKAKPTPKKVNQCNINDQATSDLVEFKNIIQLVPSGRNDASHRGAILQWVDSANSNSDAIRNDSSESSGNIVGAMEKAASDLASLASLAQDWANNNLSDPASFPTQYGNAAVAVRSDYARMSSICGRELP